MRYAILFLTLLTPLFSVNAYAQEAPPSPPMDGSQNDRTDDRPNLLAELGLSPDQLQQIRKLNQDRRPTMMAARRRMGDAMRNLDMAIYGDSVSDAEFQTRLKEFQSAEAELARLRFESELAVRKVLTPEQLVKFRDLRRQFGEMRRNRQNRRQRGDGDGFRPHGDRPVRRPIN